MLVGVYCNTTQGTPDNTLLLPVTSGLLIDATLPRLLTHPVLLIMQPPATIAAAAPTHMCRPYAGAVQRQLDNHAAPAVSHRKGRCNIYRH